MCWPQQGPSVEFSYNYVPIAFVPPYTLKYFSFLHLATLNVAHSAATLLKSIQALF